MSSNEWMPLAVQQLNEAGISPIIVQDISDVSYSYNTQVSVHPTHNYAIEFFINYMYSKKVMTVNHFEIMSNLISAECIPVKHTFDTNINYSHYYKYFFE